MSYLFYNKSIYFYINLVLVNRQEEEVEEEVVEVAPLDGVQAPEITT